MSRSGCIFSVLHHCIPQLFIFRRFCRLYRYVAEVPCLKHACFCPSPFHCPLDTNSLILRLLLHLRILFKCPQTFQYLELRSGLISSTSHPVICFEIICIDNQCVVFKSWCIFFPIFSERWIIIFMLHSKLQTMWVWSFRKCLGFAFFLVSSAILILPLSIEFLYQIGKDCSVYPSPTFSNCYYCAFLRVYIKIDLFRPFGYDYSAICIVCRKSFNFC